MWQHEWFDWLIGVHVFYTFQSWYKISKHTSKAFCMWQVTETPFRQGKFIGWNNYNLIVFLESTMMLNCNLFYVEYENLAIKLLSKSYREILDQCPGSNLIFNIGNIPETTEIELAYHGLRNMIHFLFFMMQFAPPSQKILIPIYVSFSEAEK